MLKASALNSPPSGGMIQWEIVIPCRQKAAVIEPSNSNNGVGVSVPLAQPHVRNLEAKTRLLGN